MAPLHQRVTLLGAPRARFLPRVTRVVSGNGTEQMGKFAFETPCQVIPTLRPWCLVYLVQVNKARIEYVGTSIPESNRLTRESAVLA